ncbi:end-filament protein [Sulfolobus spindle-shaped virus 7]|uniref:Putative end-filament protein n=1 Tax=Sulfolobus spindle-shaped virus 7 TaxID=693628 RepID=D1GF79_9VIRU|nr:end-filament protein [Sulfolobus spindle-shaped virus 7]ACZ35779.1 putative end-filament protein [Sulfolobus spindle-shaped virus 7]
MKWSLSLLLLTLLILPISFLPANAIVTGPHPYFDGGGGFTGPFFTYSKTIQVGSSIYSSKYNGSTLSTAPWLNPTYISVYNKYYLQVLPNQQYISNNVSLSLSSSQIALNVTWLLASSSNTGSYGSIAIGYGVNFPAGFTGTYAPASPYASDGIVVYMEKGSFPTYRLFVYFDGVKQLNVSVGSISVGQQIGLGFWYLPASNQLYVYYYNGTLKTFTIYPGQVINNQFYPLSLNTVNSNYVIDAQNVGPGYGYGQWVVITYSIFQYKTYTATLSYTSVVGNGIQMLAGFTGANNPLNISTNATSWSVVGIMKIQNFSATGTLYSLSGSISYTSAPKGIYLLLNVYPSGNINGWYLNITIEFQFVTASSTVYMNITIPVFVAGFAVLVQVNLPSSSYLAGQTISVTNSTTIMYPPNAGYSLVQPPKALINIQGLTNGFVPLPYVITANTVIPTTYDYVVNIQLGQFSLGSATGTITIYPVSPLPVIFVSQYPHTAQVGTKVTITFQFSYNTPVSNVSSSVFTQITTTFMWAYASILTSSSVIQFKAYWLNASDGFIIITQSQNYLIPFNFVGLTWYNNSINTIQINVINNGLQFVINGGTLNIANSSKVIGLGFYYGAGKLVLNWIFVSGIVLQSATANQAYVISVGTNPSTLTQYTTGYTNSSGFGQVTITLTNTPYELINIYWAGVNKNVLLNITVTQPTTSTTTTVNISTINYNYTQPFTNNIQPNSSLYNFSQYQPWSTLIGITVTALVTLLGWKFGGKAGVSGGAIMGLIMTAYLGLVPWYIFYIFVFGVAMLLAKVMIDKFMGSDE